MERRCLLCRSADLEDVFPGSLRAVKEAVGAYTPTGSDFGVLHPLVRCKTCRFVFMLSDDAHTDAQRLYAESVDSLYISQAPERLLNFKRVLSRLRRLVPADARLLDIGCSYGLLLKLARDTGFKVYGLEINRDACRYCREKLGLEVFCQDVREADFPENFFDAVTVIEVIEHLKDPKGFLEKACRILKPGGILYLVTPDTESLSARLFGRRWWSYRRMHLSYFSKTTLRRFLSAGGFSVLGFSAYKKTLRVSYVVMQMSKAGYIKPFSGTLLRLISALNFADVPVTMSFGDIAVVARKA